MLGRIFGGGSDDKQEALPAGEAGKRMETENGRESVTLRRDVVDVERTPVTDAQSAAGATIGESEEIRIPLRREEAVVEKRIVAMEEVVVRKREVEEEQVVEAELRRERAPSSDEDDRLQL